MHAQYYFASFNGPDGRNCSCCCLNDSLFCMQTIHWVTQVPMPDHDNERPRNEHYTVAQNAQICTFVAMSLCLVLFIVETNIKATAVSCHDYFIYSKVKYCIWSEILPWTDPCSVVKGVAASEYCTGSVLLPHRGYCNKRSPIWINAPSMVRFL